VHKYWQKLLRTYKKQLRKTYPPHKKSETGRFMYEEYRECIAPFVDCFGVLARVERENPLTLAQAIIIWESVDKK